jgi:hypothetical protein
MKGRLRPLAAGALLLSASCIAVARAWESGLQGWLAVHTGTESESSHYYAWWSGFGSVFPWTLLGLGGVLAVLRNHWKSVRCHSRGCWRIGNYPAAGGAFRLCGHHHPDWEGRSAPIAHILAAHRIHHLGRGRAASGEASERRQR